MSSPTESPMEIRAAGPGDVDEIIALVRSDEFAHEHSPEQLRPLFSYHWLEEKPSLGFVILQSGRLAGYLGAVYSDRRVGGQLLRFCNFTTLCLHPDFRGRARRTSGSLLQYSKALGDYALGARDCIYTAFSANRAASRLLEGFDFRRISEHTVIFRPGANASTLISRPARILSDPSRILPILEEEHRRYLRDHLPYHCAHYLVLEGSRYCYVVTRRLRVRRSVILGNWPTDHIRKRYFPAGDILYLSDPEIAFRHWEQLKWRVMLRQRVVALACDEWMLGPDGPAGIKIPRVVHRLGGTIEDRQIDKLYSEFVLLPP